MPKPLTRRDFLRVSLLGLFSLAFKPYSDQQMRLLQSSGVSTRLGRMTRSLRYYEQPTLTSKELGYYVNDTVVQILKGVVGDPEPAPHNPIWLQTEDGWLHSSYVQPVRNQLNEPVLQIPRSGFLAEVTAPYAPAYIYKGESLKQVYRFYYGSAYWIDSVSQDSLGDYWYRIRDDLKKNVQYFAHAKYFRPIQAEEIAVLSPHVAEKHIEVDLTRQRVTAFENGRPVYTTRTSTGYTGTDTPVGEFHVERKQPTRHMAASVDGNGFDLPGVPWVLFIEWTGISLHGTYWHNNYGQVMSHGCINLTPQAAKWFYRWTDPFVPVDDNFEASDHGTKVLVF